MLFRFRVDFTITHLRDNTITRSSEVVEAKSKTQAENKIHEFASQHFLDSYADVHRITVVDQDKWDLWINVHAIEAVRNDRTT